MEVSHLSIMLFHEMAVMLFWFFNPAVNGINSAYLPKNLGRFFMVLPKWFPRGLI